MQQSTIFMWIGTVLGLLAGIAAVLNRDTLHAIGWFGFTAAIALTASGTTERSRGLACPDRAMLAAVAVLVGSFLTD